MPDSNPAPDSNHLLLYLERPDEMTDTGTHASSSSVSVEQSKQNNCLVFLIPNNLLKDAGTQTLDAATTALCSAIRLLQSRRRIV